MSIGIAGTAETAITTAGTSHAVTLPAGGAASDLYLLIGDIGSTLATLNALTDWQELLDEASANGLKILIYTGAGVPGTPTFTSSASTRSAWIAYRLTGVDKTITPQIAVTGTGTSLTPDPPSLTPTGGVSKEYLSIAFAGMAGEEADDDTWGNTPPTGYTPNPPRQKACGTVGTNLGGLILSAEQLLTTGAAIDPGTFNVDVSAAWRSQHIIVHPLEMHSGSASMSNKTPRMTSTGFKGGQSAATCSNTGPRATSTGAKGAWSISGGVDRTVAFDNFEDGVVDAAFWANSSVGISESGGNGVVPFQNGANRRFRTNAIFKPRDMAFAFEVVRDNGGTTNTEMLFQVGDESNNRVMIDRLGGGSVTFIIRQGGVDSVNTPIAYNAATMRWWRIREAGGVLFCETSPDGSAWTIQAAARRTWPDSLSASVDIGTDSVQPSPPPAMLIDNFSITSTTEIRHATRVVSTGTKRGSGTATVSARTQVISSGSAPVVASGSASMSGRAQATSSGAKGGQSVASASNTGPRALSFGAKGGVSIATASTRAQATSTGAKGGRGIATCSARTTAAATGAKGGQGASSASNTTPRATATGVKAGRSIATVTNTTPRATATGQKRAVGTGRIGLNYGPPNRVLHTEEFSGASVSNLWDDINTFGEFVVAGGVLTPGWNLGDDGELSCFLPDGLDGRAVSVENVSEISNGDEFTVVYLGVRSKLPGVSDFLYLSLQLQGDGNLHIFSNRGYEGFPITVPSDTTIAYDHATMRYWRIRSEGDAFITETSPDRLVWTARQTVILAGFHDPGREVRAFLGYVDAGGPEGGGAFDNFQLESNGAPTVTATGAKGGQGSATITLRTRVTAVGSQAESHQGSASCSAGTRATASGTKSGQGAASASAKARADGSGTKNGRGAGSATAAGRVTGTGTKRVDGQAAISNHAVVNVVGEKAVSGTATVSARVTVTMLSEEPPPAPVVSDPGKHAHHRQWTRHGRTWVTHPRTGVSVGQHRRRLVD